MIEIINTTNCRARKINILFTIGQINNREKYLFFILSFALFAFEKNRGLSCNFALFVSYFCRQLYLHLYIYIYIYVELLPLRNSSIFSQILHNLRELEGDG